MKFNEYLTTLQQARRICRESKIAEPTNETLHRALTASQGQMAPDQWSMAAIHWDFDGIWTAEDRPYYRVFPSIIPMLCKLDLSAVSGTHVRMPHGLKSLLLQFPVGAELDGEVKTIWVFETQVRENGQVRRGLAVGIDHGESQMGLPVYLIRCFPTDERTIAQSLLSLPKSPSSDVGKILQQETIHRCLSMVCTLLLLGDNNELLDPDVLAKDRQRVSQKNIDALVERARKRGKRGWDVGRGIEVVPHYRRPHPALVWTGVGRSVPKVVMRSGAVVHRTQIGSVPMGYLGDIDNI